MYAVCGWCLIQVCSHHASPFVSNWYEAKAHFSDVHPLKVLDLGVEYFSEDLKTNYVRINPTEKITLNSASSGLQSVIPLLTLLSWLSDGIYQKEKPYSPNEHAELLDFIEKMRNNTTMDTAQKKQFDKMSERLMGFIEGRVYSHTQFIVEEPEQNLFPDTQCELLYSMLEALNHGKKHRMVITTHSPYILYALNNCLLAGLVQDQVPQEVLKEIKCSRAAIAPSLVRVWEIEDGRIKDNGTVIGGLYAAGNDVAEIYNNSYPLVEGVSMMSALTGGHICGEEAAKYVKG